MQSFRLSVSTTGATRNGALRSFGVQKSIQGSKKTTRRVMVSTTTNDAPTAGSEVVAPAVLEGTDETFGQRFSEDQLIARAKEVFETMTGVKDDSVLAPDFRFEFPVVSLDKDKYLAAVRGFSLNSAIPNMNSNAYHYRVDPYEPNRVWFTIRNSGTHTGALKFAGKTFEGTGKVIQGAPECCSYTFNDELKVTSFTGGYVMDRRVGNTGGMGALFGILHAIGAPVPRPGSLTWNVLGLINKLKNAIVGLVSMLPFMPKAKAT